MTAVHHARQPGKSPSHASPGISKPACCAALSKRPIRSASREALHDPQATPELIERIASTPWLEALAASRLGRLAELLSHRSTGHASPVILGWNDFD